MKFPNPFRALKALLNFSKRPEVVPEIIEAKRGATCDNCDFSSGLQCSKCTCFIPLKIKLATESCPVGKWGEYHNPKKNGLPTQ